MLPEQGTCCRPHRLAVQGAKAPAHPTGVKGRAHLGLAQHIGVAPGQGLGAAMKTLGGGQRPLHRDVAGQLGVGASHLGMGVTLGLGVKVHYLHQRMYAGVGPSGAQRRNTLAGEGLEGRFQLVLNGFAAGLALPALVCTTVVADP